MQKWTRNYVLTVQVDENAKEYIDIKMPLTVSFHIKRSVNSECNTATITVLNLAESTRRKVFLDNYKFMYYKGVELRAGYGEEVETLPLIFKGNITSAFSKRNGVDYETTIEALDGGFAYVNATSTRQFAKGTTDKQALKALIADLPNIEPGKIGNLNSALPRGNSVSGSTIDIISQYSDDNFFVDLEKMNCLLNNEGFYGNIQVINSSCGLLGSPLREEAYLTFEMIFEPRLQIGQFVKLEPSTEQIYDGTYRVVGIEHSGIISDAQSGQCKTKVMLNYIDDLPVVI